MTDTVYMRGPFWIDPGDHVTPFPPVELALEKPDGLLAFGGDLSPQRLLMAYRNGIFPWYSEGQPILWWSPDPRSVLFPEGLKISRSLRRRLKKQEYGVTLDRAFPEVIWNCARPRRHDEGTWITPEMRDAYCRLHETGVAHSAECWADEQLVGGLYGVALGRCFFGESMFSHRTDASKVAFVHLVRQLERWEFALIDCQVHSQFLESLGAELVARTEFVALVEQWCEAPGPEAPWRLDREVCEHPEWKPSSAAS